MLSGKGISRGYLKERTTSLKHFFIDREMLQESILYSMFTCYESIQTILETIQYHRSLHTIFDSNVDNTHVSVNSTQNMITIPSTYIICEHNWYYTILTRTQ